MFTELDSIATETGSRYFGPGRVLGTAEEAGFVRILLGDLSADREAEARIPVSLPVDPDPGDLVLVAGEARAGFFILAVLERGFTDTAPVSRLESSEGAVASVEEATETSTIKVFSKRQDLLFEYEPTTEKMRLHVAPGDLEINVPGSIRFQAGNRVDLVGREVNLQAESGTVRIDKMKFIGNRVDGVLKKSRLFIDRAERISKTVIEKSCNVYQTVEQLTQLRTGRLRTKVDSTYHVKARSAYLKAEQDVNVDGQRINLG
jgi:Protein of unknown function (DUF3540)